MQTARCAYVTPWQQLVIRSFQELSQEAHKRGDHAGLPDG